MASRRAYRVALSAAFAIGTLLRLAGSGAPADEAEQALARAASQRSMGALWSEPRGLDDSPPLAAVARLLDATGLAENATALRLPALICGLTLLAWLPRVVARRLGEGTGLAAAWVLALSPALVHASRVALPGAPATLFGALAAVAFLRWWICGSRLSAGLYALFAALAVACALTAAPFVLAPWIFAAGDLCVRPRTSARPKRRQILVAGLATAVALALVLAPARAALAGARPAAGAPLDLHIAAGLWVGPAPPQLAVLATAAALAGALAGALLLVRRQRRLGLFTVVLVAGQLLGVALALGPRAEVRDLLVARPALLVWLAVALDAAWRDVRSRARPAAAQRT